MSTGDRDKQFAFEMLGRCSRCNAPRVDRIGTCASCEATFVDGDAAGTPPGPAPARLTDRDKVALAKSPCALWEDEQHCYVDHADMVIAYKACACGAVVLVKRLPTAAARRG